MSYPQDSDYQVKLQMRALTTEQLMQQLQQSGDFVSLEAARRLQLLQASANASLYKLHRYVGNEYRRAKNGGD